MAEPTPEIFSWWTQIGICLGIALVLSFIIFRISSYMIGYSERHHKRWPRKAATIIRAPLITAIFGVSLLYIIEVLDRHFDLTDVTHLLAPIRLTFIIFCFTWIILRWNRTAFKELSKKSEQIGVKHGTIHALGKLSAFIIFILALLMVFQIFNLNTVPLLTFGGIGAAGLAFAAQDIIGNFFGGAMLHFTQNFSIGDEVVIPSNNNFEGTVKEIGWYVTLIEDYYRRPVYFPNALFSKTHIINESRRTHRRIKESVHIRHDALPQIEAIIHEMREKIAAHPNVDASQSYSISFLRFSDYGLEIGLYFLTYKMGYAQFMQVRQELYLTIAQIFKKYDAEIAFPARDINLIKQ